MARARMLLPFREKTEVFLLRGLNQVVAQERSAYVMFPGGGIDDGETPSRAGMREAIEEAGATVQGKLRHLATVDLIWYPTWGTTFKRMQRYNDFQGERVHIMAGRCDRLDQPTSREGDAWIGPKTMPIGKCIELIDKHEATEHPNLHAYRTCQRMALQYLWLMNQTP